MGSNHSIVTSQLSQLETTATNAHTVAQQASTAAQQAAQAATAASNSVQVSNATMSAIQTAQASIQSSLQGHTTELSTLSASCAAANSSVTSLSSQHASEVQNLQSQLSALTGASNSVTDLETELSRVDGRITSVSNNGGLTRAVVDQLIQEVVHASASWPIGSGVYTIPAGATSINNSLVVRVTALENGGGPAADDTPMESSRMEIFIIDEAGTVQTVNFVLDAVDGTQSVLASGTVNDATWDAASNALLLPNPSSGVVIPSGEPKFATWNRTFYVVASLSQLNQFNTILRHVPSGGGIGDEGSTVLWWPGTGESGTLRTYIGTTGGYSDISVVHPFPALDTPFLITFAHTNDRVLLLVNGVHIGGSPKTQALPTPDQSNTTGAMRWFDAEGGSIGMQGKAYSIRAYDGVHDDSAIAVVKSELEAELGFTF